MLQAGNEEKLLPVFSLQNVWPIVFGRGFGRKEGRTSSGPCLHVSYGGLGPSSEKRLQPQPKAWSPFSRFHQGKARPPWSPLRLTRGCSVEKSEARDALVAGLPEGSAWRFWEYKIKRSKKWIRLEPLFFVF